MTEEPSISPLRLKPKLSLDPEGAQTDSVESAAAPAAGMAEAAPAAFKLRPKTTEVPPSQPEVAPLPLPAAPVAPVVAKPPVPAAPRVTPSPELVASFSDGSKGNKAGGAGAGRSSPLLVALLLAALLGGGYYGYSTYFSPSASAPEPTPLSAEPAADSSPAAPASLPGRLVAKAEDAVAARARSTEGLEELGIEARTPAPAVATSDDSAVMAEMPAVRELPPEPEPEVSAAFRRYVTEMRVSGVFQGNPARAMLNGRTVREGDMLDLGLGIQFVGVDVEKRLLLFREASGAQAAKKY